MICCSIPDKKDIKATIENINKVKGKVDLIEIRFDMSLPTKQELILLYNAIYPKHFIFTVRNKSLLECNRFKSLIKDGYELERFLADVDYKYVSYFTMLDLPLNKIIVAYHNYKNINGFEEKLFELQKFGTKYIKIAVTPNNLHDIIRIYFYIKNSAFSIQHSALSTQTQALLFVAMGHLGVISRVLYKRFGSAWTYCCVDKGEETAPGQLTIDELLNVYRVKSINDSTRLYGIIGKDIEHSISPLYYNKRFRLLKMNCVYIPINTPTTLGLKKFINEFGFSGLSVTSPYKDKLKHVVDNYDTGIKALKVVNTLVFNRIQDTGYGIQERVKRDSCLHRNDRGRGQIFAYNTDIETLKAIVSEIIKNRRIQNALILGSGSMAKVTIYVLNKFFGIKNIYIYSRSVISLRFCEIATPFRLAMTNKQTWQLLNNMRYNIMGFDLVVNCSKFGLDNRKNHFYEKVLTLIKKNTVCIELNYKDIETPLISTAQKIGTKFYTGLDFFQRQFKEQFKVFFGKEVPC